MENNIAIRLRCWWLESSLFIKCRLSRKHSWTGTAVTLVRNVGRIRTCMYILLPLHVHHIGIMFIWNIYNFHGPSNVRCYWKYLFHFQYNVVVIWLMNTIDLVRTEIFSFRSGKTSLYHFHKIILFSSTEVRPNFIA